MLLEASRTKILTAKRLVFSAVADVFFCCCCFFFLNFFCLSQDPQIKSRCVRRRLVVRNEHLKVSPGQDRHSHQSAAGQTACVWGSKCSSAGLVIRAQRSPFLPPVQLCVLSCHSVSADRRLCTAREVKREATRAFPPGGEGGQGGNATACIRACVCWRACVCSYMLSLSSLRSVFAGSRAGSVFVHAAILDFK